jgi:hypothetical protein
MGGRVIDCTGPETLTRIRCRSSVLSQEARDCWRKDDDWQRDPENPARREIATNECAQRLKSIVQEDPAISEAYLMDNRGTLVCSIGDVSDYWQGDEANFMRTFGQGQFLFVGEPSPDAATAGGWTVPISMVVLDGPTKVGAGTLTLRVSPEMLAPAATATPVPPPAGDPPEAAPPTTTLAPVPTPSPSPLP